MPSPSARVYDRFKGVDGNRDTALFVFPGSSDEHLVAMRVDDGPSLLVLVWLGRYLVSTLFLSRAKTPRKTATKASIV